MSPATAQLVYICGSGHSGSTLLDLMLGGHSQISALGEAYRIHASAQNDSRHHRCVCGAALAACPFWQGVSAELDTMLGTSAPGALRQLPTADPWFAGLDSNGDYLPFNALPPRLPGERLSRGILVLGSRLVWQAASAVLPAARRDHLSAKNSLLIYEAVRRAHGTPIIVDSTKNPGRLKALYLQRTEPMRLIYLVRDGRAVCSSRMRREGTTMEEAARIWVGEHRRQRVARLTIPEHRMLLVHYERLCADPQSELGRICEFLGTAFETAMLTFRQDRHGVGGNPMRFRNAEAEIRVDERWRTELAPDDLATFERVAGDLNERLGYSR